MSRGSDNLASAPGNWNWALGVPYSPFGSVDTRRGAREPPFEIVRTWPYGRLTQEEQKKGLEMLKKQVYRHIPGRWCLYYRDRDSKSFNEKEEGGKGCVICLDEFVPYEEVMVTPCNHMFHEDCIVPWVKSNGRCPVCRFAL